MTGVRQTAQGLHKEWDLRWARGRQLEDSTRSGLYDRREADSSRTSQGAGFAMGVRQAARGLHKERALQHA